VVRTKDQKKKQKPAEVPTTMTQQTALAIYKTKQLQNLRARGRRSWESQGAGSGVCVVGEQLVVEKHTEVKGREETKEKQEKKERQEKGRSRAGPGCGWTRLRR
jgi:hypothetical protein